MREYPYAFHIALDGSGLNGLEGRAGVCVFKYDPDTEAYAYKVVFFGGVAGGHAPNVDPTHKLGFLGNMGQHLLFYDPSTLDEVDRVSTLRFEIPDTSIKSTTHLAWLDPTEFVASIGEQLWKFDVSRLTKAEQIGPHLLKIPHAMKRTASGRYLVYGGMDHPERGEAREVGIFDLESGRATRVGVADNVLACRLSPGARRLLRDLVSGASQWARRLAPVGDGLLPAIRVRDRRRIR